MTRTEKRMYAKAKERALLDGGDYITRKYIYRYFPQTFILKRFVRATGALDWAYVIMKEDLFR